jgi:hypothetical protein
MNHRTIPIRSFQFSVMGHTNTVVRRTTKTYTQYLSRVKEGTMASSSTANEPELEQLVVVPGQAVVHHEGHHDGDEDHMLVVRSSSGISSTSSNASSWNNHIIWLVASGVLMCFIVLISSHGRALGSTHTTSLYHERSPKRRSSRRPCRCRCYRC